MVNSVSVYQLIHKIPQNVTRPKLQRAERAQQPVVEQSWVTDWRGTWKGPLLPHVWEEKNPPSEEAGAGLFTGVFSARMHHTEVAGALPWRASC